MSEAISVIRGAIQAFLAGNAELSTLIGAGRIHDEPPRAARGVYVVHGDVDARDWSTGNDRGCEQFLSLVVWAAEPGSSKQALAAAAIIARELDGAPLSLAGHVLINLTWQSSALARDAKTGLATVAVRFRAVTETL